MMLLERMLRASALLGGLGLAGCAASPPAVVAPPVASKTADAAPTPDGIYKVGNPYQIEGNWYYPAEDYGYKQEGVASWYGQDFHGKRTANGEKYDMNDITAAHPTLPLPSVVKVTNLDNGRVLDVRINDRGPYHSSRIIDVSRRAAQLLGFYEVGTARVRVEIEAAASMELKSLALKAHPPEMPKIAAAPRAIVAEAALAPVVATGSEIKQSSQPLTPLTVPAPIPVPVVVPPKKTAALPPPPKTPARAVPSAGANSGIFVQAGAFSDIANAKRLEAQLKTFGQVLLLPVVINNTALYRVRLGPLDDDATAESLVSRVKSLGYDDAQIVRY